MRFCLRLHGPRLLVLFASMLGLGLARADATELVLGVPLLLDEVATRRQYQPLCDFLAAAAGRPCRLVTQPNFLTYWEAMRRGQTYNLLLDDAHFTDYRLQKMGYSVLAKFPDTVTYSLAVSRQAGLRDPARLVGRRIATLGIPSMGAVLLNGLFPQAAKQPIFVEVDHAAAGLALLRDGKVEAAMLPTPLVRDAILGGDELRVLLSTAPIPHFGLSAAPEIDSTTREAVQQALLRAHETPEGQALLAHLGLGSFVLATPSIYKGQARLLQDYWGY